MRKKERYYNQKYETMNPIVCIAEDIWCVLSPSQIHARDFCLMKGEVNEIFTRAY